MGQGERLKAPCVINKACYNTAVNWTVNSKHTAQCQIRILLSLLMQNLWLDFTVTTNKVAAKQWQECYGSIPE